MHAYKWHRLPDLPPEKATVIIQLSDWQQGLRRLNAHKQWELMGILQTGAPVIAWCNMPEPIAVDV